MHPIIRRIAVLVILAAVGRASGAGGLTPGGIFVAPVGGPPQVLGKDSITGGTTVNFLAYDAAFMGGVRIAIGDVTGDGVPDIITGAGPGSAGGHVKVFDGVTLTEIRSFSAFAVGFTGGVYVAAGDITGDGLAEIVVGAGAGAGPQVKVFSGADLSLLGSFFAYDAGFAGGVNVAVGDFNHDGTPDIATGSDTAGSPHVKVFDGTNFATVQRSFFAFDIGTTAGVSVGAGDVDGDGFADLLCGSAAGSASHVKVFSGKDLAVLDDFPPYGAGFTGGVYVAAGDVSGSGGPLELLVSTGTGGGSVSYFDSVTGLPFVSGGATGFLPFGNMFTGGLFIAAPAPPEATPTSTPTASPTETSTPEPTSTPRDGRPYGDFDNSGCTDINDFLILLDFWEEIYSGDVPLGINDFLALLDYWGTGPGCV